MTKFIRSTEAEATEMDQEWLVLHAGKYTVTQLNQVGGFCWTLLEQPQTKESLSTKLQNKYEVTEQEAETDVDAFLKELLQLGLVNQIES